MPDGSSWDIFISYASEDLREARAARDALTGAGWKVFLSEDDLHLKVGSKQWSAAIDGVLDGTPVLVLLVTRHSLGSRWVTYEWRSVHDAILGGGRGMVISLLSEGLVPEDLPRALRGYQVVDVHGAHRHAWVGKVSELINGYLAQRSEQERAQHGISKDESATRVANSIGPSVVSRSKQMASHRRTRWWFLAPVGIGLLFGLGVYAWATPSPSTPSVAAKSLPPAAIRSPALGLRVVELFEHPVDGSLAEIRTVSVWDEAQRDFADAAKQSRAPLRWKSAAEFAAGRRALLVGDDREAVAASLRATQLDPSWAAAQVGLSNALLSVDPEAAVAAAEKARALDRTLWIAVAALADAYLYAGQIDRALEEYRRALNLSPGSRAIEGDLALAFHYAGPSWDEEAARLANHALRDDAQLVSPHLVLAEQALEHRQAEAAMLHAQAAASLAPRDVSSRLALGDALQLAGRHNEARAAWEAAIELSSNANLRGVAGARYQEVKLALAQGRRVPPRHAANAQVLLGGKQPILAGSRSRPSGGGKRSMPSGGGCDPNDPLCGL